jgi:hypothetical protein
MTQNSSFLFVVWRYPAKNAWSHTREINLQQHREERTLKKCIDERL